jgi:hypothetical protein
MQIDEQITREDSTTDVPTVNPMFGHRIRRRYDADIIPIDIRLIDAQKV